MTRRSLLITTAIAAAAATALAAGGVLDVEHAVLLAAVPVVLLAALNAGSPDVEAWPAPPAEDRPGARTDVSNLGWAAFTRDGRVTERVLRRVRAIAATRLAAHGVRWDGELRPDLSGWGHDGRDAAAHRARAGELLGEQVAHGLATARTLDRHTLETWFHALDHLVDAPHDARRP